MSTTTTTSGETDKRNPQLLARLNAFLKKWPSGANKKFGKEIGSNETYVSRYRSNQFNGDLDEFEAKVANYLDTESLRFLGNQEIVTTDFIVDKVWAFLSHVKEHSRIGVGYGDAGRGKTCACKAFARSDKTAVYVHINCWEASSVGLVKALVKAMGGMRGVKKGEYSAELVERLTGSGRLIIIDNAHKLKGSARSWISDFWDASRCAIALVGNPDILTQFRSIDQHGSRVGIRRDITTSLVKTAEESAKTMLGLHLPQVEPTKAMIQEAVETVKGYGACRTLESRLVLTHKILSNGGSSDPLEAFAMAKTQLISAA